MDADVILTNVMFHLKKWSIVTDDNKSVKDDEMLFQQISQIIVGDNWIASNVARIAYDGIRTSAQDTRIDPKMQCKTEICTKRCSAKLKYVQQKNTSQIEGKLDQHQQE